ncbi:MAG: hypothetical protein ACRDP3_18460, partial [Streptomyces sp.]
HRPSQRTRRWRAAVLAGAGAVAVLGIGGLLVDSFTQSTSGTAASDTARGGHGSATGGDALERRVHSLLADKGSGEKSAKAAEPELSTKRSPGNNPLGGAGTTVPSCVRAGIDRTEDPIAVDESTPYKNGTGYLVVLPHRGDPQRVDAYVVDRSCVSGDATGPGEVLTTRTFPRH